MKENKKKLIVFLALYTVFLVSYFSLTTFAKYSSFFGRSGTTSVAKWTIDVAGEDNKTLPTMVIGKSSTYQDYNLSVTSTSDIASSYSIVITNVPTGLQVKVDDDAIYSENEHKITIVDVGSFTARDNNETHTHKLTFIAPLGIDSIDNQKLNM